MDNVKLWLDDNGDIDTGYTNYITGNTYAEPYVGYVPASNGYIRGMQGTPANAFFSASLSQKSHDDACAGDIVYANDNGNKMYAPYQYDAYWQKRGWKAIAAVVVPARYTPDGTIRAMSLVNMDCTNFDQGGITGPKDDAGNNGNTNGQSYLRWGPTGETGLITREFTAISTINPTGDTTTVGFSNQYAILPRDHKYTLNYSISGNSGDADAWWWYGTPAAPSPYGNQSAYSEEGQVLADMDGRDHTDVALGHVPASAFTITDMQDFNAAKNFPAFTLCARYKTTGTESATTDSTSGAYTSLGSWYLPSAGELGYLMVRQGLIFNACENVKVDGTQHHGYGIWIGSDYNYRHKPVGINPSYPTGRPGDGCWSSSERSSGSAWNIVFGDGSVTTDPIAINSPNTGSLDGYKDKPNVGLRVRAFAAF